MLHENEVPSVESKRAHFEEMLKHSDDITLFTSGACHIFALELHRRYQYPLRLIEKKDGRISHVYCLRSGQPFDVRAEIENPGNFFEQFIGIPRDTTGEELEALFTGDNRYGVKHGLWGDPEFVTRATERAKRCLENPKYAPRKHLPLGKEK